MNVIIDNEILMMADILITSKWCLPSKLLFNTYDKFKLK